MRSKSQKQQNRTGCHLKKKVVKHCKNDDNKIITTATKSKTHTKEKKGKKQVEKIGFKIDAKIEDVGLTKWSLNVTVFRKTNQLARKSFIAYTWK